MPTSYLAGIVMPTKSLVGIKIKNNANSTKYKISILTNTAISSYNVVCWINIIIHEKIFILLMIIFAIVNSVSITYAYSGRTNSQGCHHDRKNGTYHCH